MLKSITLLGSSSGRNAGDAALISGIMDSIDQAIGERLLYEIPTIKPEFVWQTYHNRVRPISMLPWAMSVKMLGVPTMRSLLRTDLSLVFDAILFDRQLYNPLFNFLSSLYLMMPLAKKRGRKMGFYNVGAGPVTTPTGQKMLREIAEMMDIITVRDQDSYDILRGIGVKNPRMVVAADAALTVAPSSPARVDTIMRELGLPEHGDLLAFNVNSYIDTWAEKKEGVEPLTKDRFIREYSEALNVLIPQIGVPVVFVATQYSDVDVTKQIMSRLKVPQKVTLLSNMKYSHFDIKGVLGRVSLLFGMRLHSQILCSSALSPIVGLAFQNKVTHYYRTLGLDQYAMEFSAFSKDAVVQHVTKGWNERAQIRARLEEVIPRQQQKSQLAATLVKALHFGENIDQIIAAMQPSQSSAGAMLNAGGI